MLARTAQQLYWIGRNLERIENTARMVRVYSNLLLDLPKGVKVGWDVLITITGSNEIFQKQYQRMDERNVVKFMLADRINPGSIMTSIAYAREGARVSREIIPLEAWEQINKLYLYMNSSADAGLSRHKREVFLQDIILSCQQLTGVVNDGMSHDFAYFFLNIGRYIERADMTTRIIDVGAADLLVDKDKSGAAMGGSTYESILWMNVLRSLSGYQIYRQHVKDRVNGEDVVIFLLRDSRFPRSVGYCVNKLSVSFRQLPRFEKVVSTTTKLQRSIKNAKVENLIVKGLPDYIDKLQQQIADIHFSMNETWFVSAEKKQAQVT
jgi:uncharacterized alpha-E superfamily protein